MTGVRNDRVEGNPTMGLAKYSIERGGDKKRRREDDGENEDRERARGLGLGSGVLTTILKPKVNGIKHYESGTFKTQINDNSTGSVKELIMGFKKITATGVRNLEKRNVLEFTRKVETYQSPGKRAQHDIADPPSRD